MFRPALLGAVVRADEFAHIGAMSGPPFDSARSRLVAVLGPTNTGKTHLAVESMLGHASGMIGLPLRLLAREIYDRVVRARGPRAVALITGEEKIVPPRAHYFVCTAEAMPLTRPVEFLAVDEIQLAADPERGHVFTDRLLHARGERETMLLGSASMAPLLRRLLPGLEIQFRERLSRLSWAGHRKLTRLAPRSAIVAFSAEQVYAIAELIRRQRGGAAVVMGSLSPRTRNAQAALYQSGEVDFLVATDAIGMGLNMDLGHVAFAGLVKFDGRRLRRLTAQETAQVAGRAGRHLRDGTFGVTGACEEIEPEMVEALEAHRFDAVATAQWRNADLDFASLADLQRSLAAPPPNAALQACEEALDERTLRALAGEPAVAERARGRAKVRRLWEVCQTPDFRKTTFEDHLRLVRTLFEHVALGEGPAPQAWMEAQFAPLDREGGGIDALSQRLAGVRTLAYIAHRGDWIGEAARWREATRRLEDRLSDELHAQLMARFIDRRTSALIRGLASGDDLLAGLGADGAVSVEGHFVGRLDGLVFAPAQGAGALAQKALRAAAQRAVAPEIARRLGALAADADAAFALQPDGVVLWRGAAAGVLTNALPFAPAVRLLGELGPAAARERAARRLEAFVAAEAGRRLAALKGLGEAVASGAIKGLARGLAWRLAEAGGVLDRREAAADLKSLSQAERRALRALGVRIGAFCLWLPEQLSEEARGFARAFALQVAPGWRIGAGAIQALPSPAPPARALGLAGMMAAGDLALRVENLEQLEAALRGAPRRRGGLVLTETARMALGWSEAEARRILRGLSFQPVGRAGAGEATAWRRRGERAPVAATRVAAHSPFAALAALEQPGARRPEGSRRRRG